MKEKHDLGLIVPLDEEFEYVLPELELTGEVRLGGTLYHRFRFSDSGVSGVVSVMYEMGLPDAALAAHDLLNHFDVPLVAVVGTAAALNDEVELGDVVLAKEIENYLHVGKIVDTEDGWGLRMAGTSWKPSHRLKSYLQSYKHSSSGRKQVKEWAERSLGECRISGGARPTFPPQYHVAQIASGDVVGASAAFREELLNHNRKLAALEMEAGGAALSGYHRVNAIDVLVARGISDRAGADKSATDGVVDLDGRPNAWRAYAVCNAINLVKVLVGAPDFPCRQPRPAPAQKSTFHTVAVTTAVTVPPAMTLGVDVGRRDDASSDRDESSSEEMTEEVETTEVDTTEVDSSDHGDTAEFDS
jgi:nucleoside phosphorylase